MTTASFAMMRLAAILATSKIFADKTIVQIFEKLCLLAAANRLIATAGLIFTNYCLFNIYCLVHAKYVMMFAINIIDY